MREPAVTIDDDVFGPGTDWRTMAECDDGLGGTAFAVFASDAVRAADALRSVKPTFGLVGDDGRVYTEDEAEDLDETYTPNHVHDVRYRPGVGAVIVADTKGVLYPEMARTMLRLIADALAVRQVSARIGRYDRHAWSGAVAYTTATDEFHGDLLRRVVAQQHEHERGIARGMGLAVLAVLDARGLAVSAAIREEVAACADMARLDVWVRRAAVATGADDLTRD